jgi:UDP-N-acetylmuramyl pentapeptide phosphotransferase/UDP-N-acetylglucosamine-1-phosphate transferase
MPDAMTWFSALAAAFVLSLIGAGVVLRILRARVILDRPNARSSHREPTPRGGGIAVIGALLLTGGAIAYAGASGALVAILALAAWLAAISWIDDLQGLGAAPRFAAQVCAVALGLAAMPGDGLVFQGLVPGWLDTLMAALLWVWFVNLYNFMDGVDGITSIQTAAIGGGLALVATAPADVMGAALVGAALGFLVWNRPPARLFLGDVGSVPLGFILGWLLLSLAIQGQWAAALLLPLYYLADATITLVRRFRRGEAVWRAHRSHFYQQAVRALEGADPDARTRAHWIVIAAAGLCNLVLLAAAVVVVAEPLWMPAALAIGALAVAVLLWYFASRTRS